MSKCDLNFSIDYMLILQWSALFTRNALLLWFPGPCFNIRRLIVRSCKSRSREIGGFNYWNDRTILTQISWLRDFTRCYDKTAYRAFKQGPKRSDITYPSCTFKLLGSQHIEIWWRHMATQIWVSIGSGNGLMPGGTKPLPQPMLTPPPRVLW